MMWSILKIYIGIGFLAIHVYGMTSDVQKCIKYGELIDGIFMPVNRTFIGNGIYSKIFQGVNMVDNRDVAMKFSGHFVESQREYEMYSHLNAIDNPEVEKYGISPIYYYNEYEHYTLTVFPLFECTVTQKIDSNVTFETIDYLILFRDFVRQSKYIHSCGIRHNDLKHQNIMLRKSRSFLIDFNIASKINDSTLGYTLSYASRRFHHQIANKESLRVPLDDWESFLYTMASVSYVKLEWFDLRIYRGYTDYHLLEVVEGMKQNTKATVQQIEKDIKCKHLKKVMVEFAMEVFKEDGSPPQYNHFEKLITDEIKYIMGNDQPAVFSWLKNRERDEAIDDLRNNPPATAKEIPEPKATYLKTDYKEPDVFYFKKCQHTMASSAKENYQHYLKEEHENEIQKGLELMKLEAENEKMKRNKASSSKSIVPKFLRPKRR